MTSQVESNYKELGISLTIKRAEEKARDLHKGQYRKTKQKGEKIPYIIHPLGVAKIISEYTDDPDTIAAGLLHDTIEDCNYNFLEDIATIATADISLVNKAGISHPLAKFNPIGNIKG